MHRFIAPFALALVCCLAPLTARADEGSPAPVATPDPVKMRHALKDLKQRVHDLMHKPAVVRMMTENAPDIDWTRLTYHEKEIYLGALTDGVLACNSLDGMTASNWGGDAATPDERPFFKWVRANKEMLISKLDENYRRHPHMPHFEQTMALINWYVEAHPEARKRMIRNAIIRGEELEKQRQEGASH